MGTVEAAGVERLLRMRFPRRLRAAARLRGYAEYRTLAEDAGISASALAMLLSGQRSPRVATLMRLALALDVSLEWLCGLDVRPDGSVKARGGTRPVAPGRPGARREGPLVAEGETDEDCRQLREGVEREEGR